MKKLILIFLQLSLLFSFCSCSDLNPIQGCDYDHLEFLTGKVIKIKDDNTILIQILEERYHYQVDDKVYVHYDKANLMNKAYETLNFDSDPNNGVLDPDYKIVLGDVVCVQSFPIKGGYEQIDGCDYRESDGPILKYVKVDDSSTNSVEVNSANSVS